MSSHNYIVLSMLRLDTTKVPRIEQAWTGSSTCVSMLANLQICPCSQDCQKTFSDICFFRHIIKDMFLCHSNDSTAMLSEQIHDSEADVGQFLKQDIPPHHLSVALPIAACKLAS